MTRQTLVLVLAGLSVAHSALAVTPQASDQQVLERLSTDWMTAVENKDQRALEAILASNYVLQMPGDSESQYTRRGEWITNALDKDWSDFHYENVVARVDGNHATVSSRLYFRIAPIPFAFDAGVVDTWEKRGTDWQVTTRYLGQSNVQQRIAFVFGVLSALVIAGAIYTIMKLVRRARRRAA